MTRTLFYSLVISLLLGSAVVWGTGTQADLQQMNRLSAQAKTLVAERRTALDQYRAAKKAHASPDKLTPLATQVQSYNQQIDALEQKRMTLAKKINADQHADVLQEQNLKQEQNSK